MAKGKKAVKKALKKIVAPKAVKKPMGLMPKLASVAKKAAPAIVGAAVGAGIGVAATKLARRARGRGVRRARSARQLLKKAYESRAKRQVRQGMLGHARRTLRKKATVV